MVDRPCIIISRHLGCDRRPASLEDELADLLYSAGWHITLIPHLYHLPHGSELWARITALPEPLVLASWLHPRPSTCLLYEYAGREPALAIDLSACSDAGEACASITDVCMGSDEGRISTLEAEVNDRWYPVIDRSLCTGCRHCLQFCLFGVYEIDAEGGVTAARPDNCKPGCPACSRVCPQGAIIFPLCDDPAIAGAPGTIMKPDAAARRAYYVRTGQTCPVCGRKAEPGEHADAPAAGSTCDECGSPTEVAREIAEPSPVHREIDELIDALDGLADARGGEQR